jgi:hypothetical protein
VSALDEINAVLIAKPTGAIVENVLRLLERPVVRKYFYDRLKKAPRCFPWVDLGGQPPKPPGILRFGACRQKGRMERASAVGPGWLACRIGP